MEKKFKVLRIIGTVWKVLAWIMLIVGALVAFGSLLVSIFGGSMVSWLFGQAGQGQPQGATGIYGILGGFVGGVVIFLFLLILAVIEFLLLYAIGDLIYLFLDIEGNTRLAAQWLQVHYAPQAYPVAAPVYVAPPPPTYTPPPPIQPASQ